MHPFPFRQLAGYGATRLSARAVARPPRWPTAFLVLARALSTTARAAVHDGDAPRPLVRAGAGRADLEAL
jgi:hypothetical protein